MEPDRAPPPQRICRNWSACPFGPLELSRNYFASAAARIGFEVTSKLKPSQHETGSRHTDVQMNAINIRCNWHVPRCSCDISNEE